MIMSRVLTIEDDEITANEIVGELKSRGFTVDWVANGRDGMARAISEDYDVITLDRMLPGVDGLTILTTMRSIGIQTPVLMLSLPSPPMVESASVRVFAGVVVAMGLPPLLLIWTV